MSKTRFALIGAGSIAQDYLAAFAASETSEVVAVADTNLEAAVGAAAPYGCRVFDSHASLLRTHGFDAALICTPPSSHAPIALDLLRCGIHVLCEQPFAVDVASARRMLHVARRFGVTLTMASKFRYVGDVIQAQAFIASGLLGDVLTFENSFTSSVAMAGQWHANPAMSGGGVVIDKGTQSVDILRYLCGPVTAIAAYEGARVQALPVEDTAHLVARTGRGVLGSIDLSWSCNQETDSYVRVSGTQGSLTLGWARSKFRHGDAHGWISFGSGCSEIDALRDQIDNFSRSLRGEEELLVTSEDALACVATIAAAYRSLRGDRWIAIDSMADENAPALPELAPVSAAR
jgi:predicted dehydrogenase